MRETDPLLPAFARCRAVPAVAGCGSALLERIHGATLDQPAILRGFTSSWPATLLWDRDHLLQRCGDVTVRAYVDLPGHAVPYLKATTARRRVLSLAAYWELMTRVGRCYLDQYPVEKLPGIQEDLRWEELFGGRRHTAPTLWIGRGTKSGLHFDSADNLLVMIRGEKVVALAAPRDAPRLYPFLDAMAKSQVDVESPDFARYPEAAAVEMWTALLRAGDVLYIPRGWWHHLSSPTTDYCISVNCWFGRRHSLPDNLAYIARLGPRYVRRTIRDFLLHGALRRPYDRRTLSGPPDGFVLFQHLARTMRRRLPIARGNT